MTIALSPTAVVRDMMGREKTVDTADQALELVRKNEGIHRVELRLANGERIELEQPYNRYGRPQTDNNGMPMFTVNHMNRGHASDLETQASQVIEVEAPVKDPWPLRTVEENRERDEKAEEKRFQEATKEPPTEWITQTAAIAQCKLNSISAARFQKAKAAFKFHWFRKGPNTLQIDAVALKAWIHAEKFL